MNVEDYNNLAESFNYIEIVLWSLFGFALLLKSRSVSIQFKKTTYISATAFFAFAVSDYIEIQTGAWWRPWPLFVLKAICVITFAYSLYAYMNIKSKNVNE